MYEREAQRRAFLEDPKNQFCEISQNFSYKRLVWKRLFTFHMPYALPLQEEVLQHLAEGFLEEEDLCTQEVPRTPELSDDSSGDDSADIDTLRTSFGTWIKQDKLWTLQRPPHFMARQDADEAKVPGQR